MLLAKRHDQKPAGVRAPRLRRLLAYLVITHRLVVRPPAGAPPGEEEALIEQLGCYEREEPPLAQEDASFSQVGRPLGCHSCTMTCWKPRLGCKRAWHALAEV